MRIVLVALALSPIGCTPAFTAGDRREPLTHTVTIEGMKFGPQELTVALGDVVVWVNKDWVPHTATASEAGMFDSGLIASDKSWKFTAYKKGDLAYVCTYHPTMKAMLHVE